MTRNTYDRTLALDPQHARERVSRLVWWIGACVLTLLVTVGCESQADEAGDALDDAADEVSDVADDALDAAEDAVDEAGDAVDGH